MPARRFADRIGDIVTLTDDERDALDRLVERDRPVRRGATLVRENERSNELFVLGQGMMMAYALLDDGSRQILRFLFPGDVIGMSALAYPASPVAIAALADSVVHPFDRARLAAFGAAHPRLLLALTAIDQAESAALTDRLAGVGRTSAKARIAAVLLDIRDRQRRVDPAVSDSFVLGLTQEEIGDATGLTAVHVNRMLRQLEEQRLIARSNGRVTLLDEPAMRRAANYVDRVAAIDLAWLGEASGG